MPDFRPPTHSSSKFENCSELRTGVYPSNFAPVGTKLWENAFQTVPGISIFAAKNSKCLRLVYKLWTAVCPSRIAPIGLKLGQNAFQTIPGISFFDAQKVENWQQKFWNFRTAVYPPRIARIGLKLGQNAFQTIPNISSFDPETLKNYPSVTPISFWRFFVVIPCYLT